MPIARFQMPDGRVARFEVPDGTTPEQAQEMIKAATPSESSAPISEPSEPDQKQGALANISLGAIKGASDIGATLLKPVDYLLNKAGISDMTNAQRRQSLASFFNENADPESIAFKGGELTTDIAGTAGAGGLIAKGLRAIPMVAKAAPKLINAIESGGFRLGSPAAQAVAGKVVDAGTRAAGGAVLGGASAGMIDPETAGTGAVIGGALPGGAKISGVVGNGIKNGVSALGRNTLGVMTGTGSEAVRTAFEAGKAGNPAFIENLRGRANMTDVLDEAKSALNAIRNERSAAYKQGMMDVSADKSVLDFSPVLKSLDEVKSVGSFKGQPINKNASAVIDQLTEEVGTWAKLNPAEFHTPEGLDALKKSIGDIRASTQPGTAARKAADSVYNSIKKEINAQAPTYSKTMKDYAESSDLISEVERSLSLGEKASADTAMRKLQSLMRNNVSTNYGNRLNLASELEKRGANIMPAVAGQAMSSLTPRGLQALAATGTGALSLTNPLALALLPLQSPRLVGEAAFKAGQAAGGVRQAAKGLLGSTLVRQQISNPENFGLLTAPAALMSVQ